MEGSVGGLTGGGDLRGGMGRWKRWGNGRKSRRFWGFERGGEGVEKGLRL